MKFMNDEFKQRVTALYMATTHSEPPVGAIVREAEALQEVCSATGLFPSLAEVTRTFDHQCMWAIAMHWIINNRPTLMRYLDGLNAYVLGVESLNDGEPLPPRFIFGLCRFIELWCEDANPDAYDGDGVATAYVTWNNLHAAGIVFLHAANVYGPAAERIATAKRLQGTLAGIIALI